MFRILGKTVSRAWPVFLILWAVIVALAYWSAPPWNDVALDKTFAFLPANTISQRGEALFKKTFPSQWHPSSLAMLFARSDGVLTDQDKRFIAKDVRPGLDRIAEKEGGLGRKGAIGAIHAFTDPGSGLLLISEDQRATVLILELSSELLAHRNWAVMDGIDHLLHKLQVQNKIPPGLKISLSGNAAVGYDVSHGQAVSARSIEYWTIGLVIVLLVLIYRAPLLALIPLVTIFVAVDVALKYLSVLAEAEIIGLFQGIQTFLTVILYGAGVDYCFFLIARYREELDRLAAAASGEVLPERERYRQALATAVGKVGAALTASAATVTIGIGMMTFASFGQFHQAGIAISASLVLTLCAVLTLAPALLRLAGPWAFWPHTHWTARSASTIAGVGSAAWWTKLANALQRRPGTIWLVSVLLMLPLGIFAYTQLDNLEIDLLKRLHPNEPSVVATRAFDRYFPAGFTGPIVALIRSPGVNFRQDQGEELIGSLTDRLSEQKKELGVADIRSLSAPLGVSDRAQDAIDELVEQAAQMPSNKSPTETMHRHAQDFYVSSDGHVTQLQIILTCNPLGQKSLDLFARLEKAIKAALPDNLQQPEILYLGQTVSVRDLTTVTYHDQDRIELLVASAVFLILLLLLRRPVVSFYLVLSVLLSFYTTLGATFAFFWAINPHGFTGLDWKVPIFLFTILVAVGEDYNIFLMTRIHEEQEAFGPLDGITHALVRTGRIITSCGLIMAGTFATLLSGTLLDLKQLGFALACGVLLDTFVVRPILVPAFLILLHKYVVKKTGGRKTEDKEPKTEVFNRQAPTQDRPSPALAQRG